MRIIKTACMAAVLLAALCTVLSAPAFAGPADLTDRPQLAPGTSNATLHPHTDALGLMTTDLNGGLTPQDLVNALVGAGVSVSNVTYSGANVAAGKFSGGTGIIGFESGIILSSGNVGSVPGPNVADDRTTNNGLGGDADLDGLIPGFSTHDATVLEFDFECTDIQQISFQFVFTSDEYNEYVHTQYNDVFGFFVNGVNVALLPDNVTPVSINTINCNRPFAPPTGDNCIYYRNNDLQDGGGAINTEMDGLTVILVANAAIHPGLNHMKLAIADAGDWVLDSDIFLKGESFICGAQHVPPQMFCPPDMEVECVSNIPPPDVTQVVCTALTPTTVTWVGDSELEGGPCHGAIQRTYQCTDEAGNVNTCVQTIFVTDITPPDFACPPDLRFECNVDIPPCEIEGLVAGDNCGGLAIPVTCTRTSNEGLGCPESPLIYTDTYSASDQCGNTKTCTRTITIVDDKAPEFQCPPNLDLECIADVPPCSPPNGYMALDNCDGPVPVQCFRSSNEGQGCPENPLLITDTYIAFDKCNNEFKCTRQIVVIDTKPPVVTCPPDLRFECDAQVPPCDVAGMVAQDNCDGPVPVNCFRSTNEGQGCPGSPLIYTDTYTAFDHCGNEGKCTRTITVVDDQPPVVDCPPDLRFACRGDVPPECSLDGIFAKDNCDGEIPVSSCTRTANGGAGCPGNPLIITDTYFAADHCGNVGTCKRTITVIDDVPPTIACPADFAVQGLENLPLCDATGATAYDNCGQEVSLKCSRNSFGGIACGNGPVYAKYTYTATDACGNTATCVQKVTVILPPCNFIVAAGGPTGTVEAPVGTQVSVPISIDSAQYEIGRMELAFAYDPAAVSILNVTKGAALSEWEFFTYRISSDGASNVVRLTAIADQGSDGQHPSDYAYRPEGPVAYLNFLVSTDRRFVGTDIPVSRYQSTCSDNVFTGRAEDVSFVSKDAGNCGSGLKADVERAIVFNPGRIKIVAPSLQLGDINLNNVAYEVGDAVLLVNYFVSGNDVLSADADLRALQINASDVNHDGTPLSVADLVYLTRVITGDASPLVTGAKLSPYAGSASAAIRTEDGAIHLSTNSSVDVGAALFTMRYSGVEPGTPLLSAAASDLSMKSHAQNGELRVLVYGWENGARINSGSGELLTIPTTGSGSIELVSVEMSDASGSLLAASAAKSVVPGGYVLLQNYPNPFNAATVIHYRLADAGHVQLAVYNVLGQSIRTLVDESQGAGDYSATWDGRDDAGNGVGSGMYFYRLQVGEMVAIRKMTLLK